MRSSLNLFALGALLISTSVQADTPTSPNPYPNPNLQKRNDDSTNTSSNLSKRGLCFFGVCLGGGSTSTTSYNLQSDPLNCGFIGNNCNNFISGLLNIGSGGAICSNGVCGPASCKSLFDYNWLTHQCQDVSSDTSNCGKCGQSCSTSSFPGSSAVGCSSGSCIATACQNGYTLSSGKCNAVNTQSDVNNCGKIGNKCSFPNGYGSCSWGQCQLGGCNSGYYNVNGVCTALNLNSDLNNCGSVGNVCQFSNGVATCSSGSCQLQSCNAGYQLQPASWWSSASCSPINTQSDSNNCGALNYVCAFPNGYGSCSSGKCTLSGCNNGYYNIGGTCKSLNLQTDSNNCGSVGNVCQAPNGVATCSNGQCQLQSCNSGYALQTTSSFLGLFGSTSTCTQVNTLTDPNNCGKVGNVCPGFVNGGPSVCLLGKCQTSCNFGFDWDSSLSFCRPVQNDASNCGSCGNVCKVANGVAACQNGQCTVASCNQGYSNVNGQCIQVNTQTDINNCGKIGNKCPSSFLGGTGTQCVNGVCQPTSCVGLFDWDPLGLFCRDVSSDNQNCGKCGQQCVIPNGQGKCVSGQCQLASCNSGFYNINGVCTSMNLNNDMNNCGSIGNKCQFTNGQGTCSNGKCTYTSCNTGYALISNTCSKVDTSSDPNNCGKVGNVCQGFVNGGPPFCLNGVCQSLCNIGFDFDFGLNFCRDCRSDANNCGKCGNSCLSQLPGATAATCNNGNCAATSCQTGYQLVSGQCQKIDTNTNPQHCGWFGNCCTFTPQGAQGTCVGGICTYTSCPSGYILQNNKCVQSTGPSQKARAKRSKIEKPKELCPDHETACPIVGSSSFASASDGQFSSFTDFINSGALNGAGGYECLDTKQALDSCGGCASTGEGQDCTKIRGAVGVGCDDGKCVVFSCQAGWKPNLAANKCVRAHGHGHNESSEDSDKSSSSDHAHAARRHLSGRSHGHAARHHGHAAHGHS